MAEAPSILPCVTLRISCNDKLWKQLLEHALKGQREVELINVDEEVDGEFCHALALQNGMLFSVDSITSYGSFKRKLP